MNPDFILGARRVFDAVGICLTGIGGGLLAQYEGITGPWPATVTIVMGLGMLFITRWFDDRRQQADREWKDRHEAETRERDVRALAAIDELKALREEARTREARALEAIARVKALEEQAGTGGAP